MGIKKRLGNLQRHREEILRSLCRAPGKETDVVTLPIQHDSAAELAQPLDVKDWKKGECDLIPRRNRAAHYSG